MPGMQSAPSSPPPTPKLCSVSAGSSIPRKGDCTIPRGGRPAPRRRIALTARWPDAYAVSMRSARWITLAFLLLARVVGAQAPSCAFGPGALPADTNPGGLHGNQIPIQHIVVLMQENRSYDHYFGRLRRQSGPPKGTTNPDPLGGSPIKPFHTKRYCEVDDLDHSWSGTHREWNGGAM